MEELVIRNTFLNANQLFVDGQPEHTLVQADRDCPCPVRARVRVREMLKPFGELNMTNRSLSPFVSL
jgi:hypothetical protein